MQGDEYVKDKSKEDLLRSLRGFKYEVQRLT